MTKQSDIEMVAKARAWAVKAHAGQKDKAGKDYFNLTTVVRLDHSRPTLTFMRIGSEIPQSCVPISKARKMRDKCS